MRGATQRRAHTAAQLRRSTSDGSTGRQPPYQGSRSGPLAKPGEEGLAAQRCLNRLYLAVSFYLPLDDLPGRYAQVAVSYELSLMIRDDNAVVWYNLACVRARLGQRKTRSRRWRNRSSMALTIPNFWRPIPISTRFARREDFKALLATVPASWRVTHRGAETLRRRGETLGLKREPTRRPGPGPDGQLM